MTRLELRRTLAEAGTAPKARARMLLEELLPALAEPWLDASMRADIEALAARCGRRFNRAAPRQLDVGETWLLLLAGPERGDVVRVRARGDGAAGGCQFDEAIGLALRGLRAATRARQRELPSDVFHRRFTVAGGEPKATISGSSLGLAACVAAISLVRNQPPLSNVAGSAEVNQAGNLQPITGIETKVRALRTQWPHVDTLVVAADQALAGDFGMQIVRAATVVEAIAAFGLTLPDGGLRSKQTLEQSLVALRHEDVQPHTTKRWGELSVDAEALADDLEVALPEESLEALLLSGLFASHAGNPQRARAILGRFPVDQAPPELLARERVLTASSSIEVDPNGALLAAAEGVERCRQLGARDQREWLGRALGTHGRVLVHVGRASEAEPLLRAALKHHERDDDEAPRSASYLAQCLRHQGRADEAADVASTALGRLRTAGPSDQDVTNRLFALLERGRARLCLGLFPEAIEDLEHVVDGQQTSASYPSLGARRSLVQAHLGNGDDEAARRHLRVCLDVALAPSDNVTLRKVGAVAAGEELLRCAGGEPLVPLLALEEAWRRFFSEAPTEEVIAPWVY